MRNIAAGSVFCIVFLLAGGIDASRESIESSSTTVFFFCPGCAEFLDDTSSDECEDCLRRGVEAEAMVCTWIWCDRHKVWHEDKGPLADRGVDEEKSALALIVDEASTKLHGVAYCPKCKNLLDQDSERDENGNCRGCDRPPAHAAMAIKTWFWCDQHEEWHRKNCDVDGKLGCCTATQARALATFGAIQP